MVTGVKLQHHVLADGEFHDAHRLYVGERQIHRVMVRVVAHQPDAFRPVGTVHVLYGQIVVTVNVEGHQIHFSINDTFQAADFLESDDVSGLKDRIHAVSADIYCPIALRDIGDTYAVQNILALVSQQRFQIGSGCNVV